MPAIVIGRRGPRSRGEFVAIKGEAWGQATVSGHVAWQIYEEIPQLSAL